MRNFNITISTVIVIILCLFSSCEIDITDELSISESESLLVIEGGIERHGDNNVTQRVRLTKTINFLSKDDNPIVEDAHIEIADGSQTWILKYLGNGYYGSDEIMPEINSDYTISIEWEDNVYQASETLLRVAKLERFSTAFQEETAFEQEGYFPIFDILDPIGMGDFYFFKVYRNGDFSLLPDQGNSTSIIRSDEFFDGELLQGISPNQEIAFQLGDMCGVEVLSISKDYYDYLYQIFTQTISDGISFGGTPPPASIRGNLLCTTDMNKRALGYFYASDISSDEIMVK